MKADESLQNFTYVTMVLQYFFIQLIDPFQSFLADHTDDKIKLKKLIRVKLLVFLVKTKVIIKFLENCCNVRPNDVLAKDLSDPVRKQLESSIVYVFLDEKKNCAENYDKIGKNMQRFFFSLLKANDIKIDYKASLDLINDPLYYQRVIDEEELAKVERKTSLMQNSDILKPSALFNYLGNTFNDQVSDYAELHFCFPNPEFLYLYYKLIDSKWTSMGLSIISSSVKCYKKFYLPLSLFEDEFCPSSEYLQTRVRVLKDSRFWENIDPEFLVQKEFLNKKSMIKSLKKEYAPHFQKSLKEYQVFDRESIKGRLKEITQEMLKNENPELFGSSIGKFFSRIGNSFKSKKSTSDKNKLYFEFDESEGADEKVGDKEKKEEEFIEKEDKEHRESEGEINKDEKKKFMRVVMFSPENVRVQHFEKQTQKLRQIKRVVLHYHGGGFICMSSKSHQKYLRFAPR